MMDFVKGVGSIARVLRKEVGGVVVIVSSISDTLHCVQYLVVQPLDSRI